jgi:hypothetical protein
LPKLFKLLLLHLRDLFGHKNHLRSDSLSSLLFVCLESVKGVIESLLKTLDLKSVVERIEFMPQRLQGTQLGRIFKLFAQLGELAADFRILNIKSFPFKLREQVKFCLRIFFFFERWVRDLIQSLKD